MIEDNKEKESNIEGTEEGKPEAAAKEEVVKMCEKLLANTVIEDYQIEIVG